MVLHSRAKEFILITADEYSTSLSLRKTEQNDTAQPVNFAASSEALESTNRPILEREKASLEFPSASECAQWNLNSRFRKRPQTSSISDVKKVKAASQSPKSENVIIELLSVGLSGGKVERSRQRLRKINEAENVSIDKSSGRILLHDRDSGVSIFDFFLLSSDNHQNAKRSNSWLDPTFETARLSIGKHECQESCRRG